LGKLFSDSINHPIIDLLMKSIKRREFIKITGILTTGSAFAGCSSFRSGSDVSDLAKMPLTRKVIDTHLHAVPETVDRCIRVMDDNYIQYGINIGIGGEDFIKFIKAIKDNKDRLGALYSFDWSLWQKDPGFPEKAPDMLERAIEAGALGVKIFKELGLKVTDNEGKLVKIDDPRLFPIWEKAEQLNTIVAIHTVDPVAFFETWNSENERWEELELRPEWSFADRDRYPARNVVLEQRNNVIRTFKNINFQCAHVGNYSENLEIVDQWLDEMPNMVLDLSARIGELGRHPASEGKKFFTKHQDRLMFGTDRVFRIDGDIQGAGPKKIFTPEEDNRFYESHWRYLQTLDTQFDHPTPIQGNWKIDGIGLPENILKKIYWDNAFKLYNIQQFVV